MGDEEEPIITIAMAQLGGLAAIYNSQGDLGADNLRTDRPLESASKRPSPPEAKAPTLPGTLKPIVGCCIASCFGRSIWTPTARRKLA